MVVVWSGRFTFAAYTMVYTQFTSTSDHEVRRVIARWERAVPGPGLKLVKVVLIFSRLTSWESSECF